ncbi:hypothetical protein A33M_0413 [Rhodovulum sp. PH10]|uniref:hypothetical protein n=1 Tax=Rhodovulum sp. PH10 TaxID=1187851 RepID=UPI00027C26E4|nr:hypothetical protein [Rhodovulum sp. PH10]EJW10164.1 hypothetical protein A33M_0413 [Rhodovulum sp. PH10]
MAPTPAATAAGYRNLWSRAEIDAARRDDAAMLATRIGRVKGRYAAVQAATGVPWPVIAALHVRESDLSFAGHLHNGDPLRAKTRRVPKGRPKVAHGPPYGWEESAIDALTMAGHRLDRVENWSVERILYECERYNGWGYLGKINSPYLWSWTNLYHAGKYVRDHVYSPTATDAQPGCVAVFKSLIASDPEAAIIFSKAPAEAAPPKAVTREATRKARAVRDAGAASAAAGTGSEVVTQTGTVEPDHAPVLTPLVASTLIGSGVAVVLVAGWLAVRRKALIERAWTGASAGLCRLVLAAEEKASAAVLAARAVVVRRIGRGG